MRFVFVNHVTTNPFFVPTRYGAEDACELLGCSYQWTGSESANVNEMVNALNSAISSKVDGIAVAIVDLKAFNEPIKRALDAGIPVVGYNADAPGERLAYIGQDLFVSGQEMGKRIVELVGEGDVALFIATPGSLNIQPRIDGAIDAIKKSGGADQARRDRDRRGAAEGALDRRRLLRRPQGREGHVRRRRRQHAGRGPGDQEVQPARQGRQGRRLRPARADHEPAPDGQLDFTIDQQPYLQGFFPVFELFFYQASKTLTGVADINTGLKFLDKETVVPYVTTKSRYEGNSETAGVTSS